MDPKYLSPTAIIDSDHPSIRQKAKSVAGDASDPVQRAVALYRFVRDGIRYDPYYPFYLPVHYRASNVLKSGRGYCVSKAALLCALGRACRIASRVGFATVRNHLATRQLLEYLGTDLFVYHGYNEFYLGGKWVRATPAFNASLCRKHHVAPLDFDGRSDALFQPYNRYRQKFMEYVDYLGTHADIPVEKIVCAFKQTYGTRRVNRWIAAFEAAGERPIRDFYNEQVVKNKERKMQDSQKEERDALCPECGHAFKAYVDRLVADRSDASTKETVDCPVCGCGECRLHR